jgi:hypothetical protein
MLERTESVIFWCLATVIVLVPAAMLTGMWLGVLPHR